jgi:bacterioferritin-associated ferredoxin
VLEFQTEFKNGWASETILIIITRSGGTAMIVCLCEAVNEREVRRTIRAGACTVREVARACGAGSGCGMCRGHVRELLREAPAPEQSAGKVLVSA